MSYNVLIIDDSTIVRKMIRKTIGMTAVPVGELVEAGDGREGLTKLKEHWVDLVFLDINMPVMNGVEFLEAVRSNPELKDTPVIVVSTEGATERIERLKQLGIKAFLRKPVTPEALAEAITNTLEGEK
jgi:two-component system chemotaxis response regulator CheY